MDRVRMEQSKNGAAFLDSRETRGNCRDRRTRDAWRAVRIDSQSKIHAQRGGRTAPQLSRAEDLLYSCRIATWLRSSSVLLGVCSTFFLEGSSSGRCFIALLMLVRSGSPYRTDPPQTPQLFFLPLLSLLDSSLYGQPSSPSSPIVLDCPSSW